MTDEEYWKIRERYHITNMVMNITDDCNLCCPYCFTTRNNRVSDLETVKAAVMFLINECKSVSGSNPSFAFFGGEPMLQFERIIVPTVEWAQSSGLCEKHHLSFSMTTNGTLLTRGKLKWLKENHVQILLSIDGDRQTQDSQRPGHNRKSSFDMLEPILPEVVHYFPDVTFRSTLEPYNAGYLYENYLFARRNGFRNYYVTPNTFADWSIEQTQVMIKQLSLITDTIYQDISSGKTPTLFSDFINALKACFRPKEAVPFIPFQRCGLGIVSVGVSVSGDLNGCQEHNTYLEHDIFYIGNITDGIDPHRHKALLEAFQSLPHPVCKENPMLCNTCSYYEECSLHFCPSHNSICGHSLCENDLVSCLWRRAIQGLAYIMLERTVAEHNDTVVSFLEK